MFYVLCLKEGSVLKRRKLYLKPRLLEKRVQGGLNFYVIESARYRKKVNFKKIWEICGRLKCRLILPEDIERPSEFNSIDCKNFYKLLTFNSVYEIIKNIKRNDKRTSMCIIDEDAAAAQKLSFFVPYIANIYVKTKRKDIYQNEIKRVMDEYGAKVRFCEKANSQIVLNLDNEPCEGDAVFEVNYDKNANDVVLPYCYSSLCPDKINRAEFACALYEFSKVSALDCVRFSKVKINNKSLEINEASSTLKRLCY